MERQHKKEHRYMLLLLKYSSFSFPFHNEIFFLSLKFKLNEIGTFHKKEWKTMNIFYLNRKFRCNTSTLGNILLLLLTAFCCAAVGN